MGLKRKNYIANGVFCAEAYAMFETADTKSKPAIVTFKIHNSRENADKLPPLERKKIFMPWDRNTDIVKEAYKFVKTRTIQQINPETQEVEVVEIKSFFSDWEDDIVTQEGDC